MQESFTARLQIEMTFEKSTFGRGIWW